MEHFERLFRCKTPTKAQPALENIADARSRAPTCLLLTEITMLAKAPQEINLYNPRVPFFC